jgi:multisubunit Na+/H+ antiporter MnhB subunit
MHDLETLLKDIKNPRHIALSALTFLFCMFLGYARGSIGGLIVGILVGIFLSLSGIILIHKHEEKQKEIKESLVIPKIGMTDRIEHWLRKKKLQEVKNENRIDLIIKIVWWIIFVIIGLIILYLISPIIYYTLQVA